jgi:dolichol-phosphate mannosyltransferase
MIWSNRHEVHPNGSIGLVPPARVTSPAETQRHQLPARIAAALRRAGASQRRCLVVVPTYNEASNIAHLAAAILSQGPQFDVLVVDDNSPDGTGGIADALAARSPRVQVLHRPAKLGLGSAYVAGFAAGLRQGYEFLCEMDADFSHQPCYLPRLLAAAEHDADVVLGSRNVPGGRAENWTWLRAALSRGGSFNARAVLGLPIRDCTGGFKCFRADALRQIRLDAIRSNGYAFQIELNYRCFQAGLRIQEVPIVFPNRVAGYSKMSWRIVWEAAVMIWRLRLLPNSFLNASETR